MDTHQLNQMLEKRPPLEPIEEASEQEDESVGSRTDEEEEEKDLEFQEGAETEEIVAENEREEEGEDDDDDDDDEDNVPLRVLRPRRSSGSVSQKSFIQIQSDNHKNDNENSLVSDLSIHASDLSDEDVPLPKLGNQKRLSIEKLRKKVSNIKWQKQTTPKSSMNRKRKINKELEEPFPKWVVNLMVNIEEATTHQLVVE
ncbi:nuclear polyadenylated RNA-binding protein 3 [Kryptolebias marmoratus]|uniref:nuclear polyadenylated RNA-binding protein 3 n=1 Tax=Kryptolebias marmoratus TaxID=37003 RepID=UPI000D530295|nr:nuclear polyadenylated RNA-binding protein 3 [Kryptolebias marmoratus]